MKTFAVILLMLFSFSFLKAQMMVVETADTVESFEVREIKSLNASEKKFKFLKIGFTNIPIIIKNRDGKEGNGNYSNWQSSILNPNINADTMTSIKDAYINFVFINEELGNRAAGGERPKFIKMVFDKSNIIKSFYWITTGSKEGCYHDGYYRCSVGGTFEITFNAVPFTIDSLGQITVSITGKNVTKYITQLNHLEVISYTKPYKYETVELLSILEEDLTDDSQIIITIE